MRIRTQGEYKAFFTNSGKTIRLSNGAPQNSELEDVAINDKCLANCSYCYTDAKKSGTNFKDIITKALYVWGTKDMNDRPFQIAIGGAGEPTMHPDFCEFIRCVKDLGILPNYTTNGMHLTDSVLNATERYCGGVALSWHPHIFKVYHRAIPKLQNVTNKLNTHVIIGTKESLTQLKTLYNTYERVFDYFVILPYQAVGRACEIETHKIWGEMFDWINSVNSNKFAFGALFFDYLKNNNVKLDISVYDPDVYSGYRLMDERYKIIYKSSYDITVKATNYEK